MDTKTCDAVESEVSDEATGLVELGEVSRDTHGFLLGLFSDAGLGRRMVPL